MKREWKWVLFYVLTVSAVLLSVISGSRMISVMSENKPFYREHCIVIDPGHGGEDGGAVSCTGLPESGYNLEISLRLQDLLHLLGYDTKMIRTEDVSVYTKGASLSEKKISDLRHRVQIANETDGSLLLSIHQNYFPDPKYQGGQIFFADTEGSEDLAKQLQILLVESLNTGSRRQAKKSSGIYLMEHIHCPGVLVECGFLSNPQEEVKLRDPAYQKKLSTVISVAVSRFLSNT